MKYNIEKIIIGSRESKLAKAHIEIFKKEFYKKIIGSENLIVDSKFIKTTADKFLDKNISEIGNKGLFTKEIDKEQINNNIHIGIHSLKDLPTKLKSGLEILSVLKRGDHRDALYSEKACSLDQLKSDSVIGTSSIRRRNQILNLRPDIVIKDIRGNVDTRIKKLKEGKYDAIILSYAGIKYLQLENEISESFTTKEIIPSAGQGIIALQCREDNQEIISILKKINHDETYKRAHAERNILKVLEGDCETAVGAHAIIDGENIIVEAELFSLDGSKRFYEKKTEKIERFKEVGEEIGKILKIKSNNLYKR